MDVRKNFYVIAPVFNPCNYKSRVDLYFQFEAYMKACGVNLVTAELAFGEMPFQVTQPDNPSHLQFRTDSVLWHKERLINLAVQRLPLNWKYVAWIDADIKFLNERWLEDTIEKLQFHPVVQMWVQALDLSPTQEVLKIHDGYGHAYHCGTMSKQRFYQSGYHSGFAWACTKAAFNNLGGLIDYSILGSADRQMADCLIGQADNCIYDKYAPGYSQKLRDYANDCDRFIRGNVGAVPGAIIHYWHGSKKDRGYGSRYNILYDHQFDPDADLEFDHQGLYRWTDRSPKLHYAVYKYFLSRNEDGIEVDNFPPAPVKK